MAGADGSIVIEVKTDSSQAEKNLKKLTDDINKTEREIYETQEKRKEASQRSVFSAAELDAEKAKLEELKNQLKEIQATAKDKTVPPQIAESAKAQIPDMQTGIKEQQARVNLLQTEYNKLAASVEKYDDKLASATQKLNQQKDEAGGLIQKINTASRATEAMTKAYEKAQASARKFSLRIQEIVRNALFFNIASRALSEFMDWMWSVIKTNEEASASIARLKGALLTLVQPLVEVILPAFTTLVNVLTQIISVIARLVSILFGKTVEQSKKAAQGLSKQTAAYGDVGTAAEEAAGSLAAFDEINTISTENASAAEVGDGGVGADGIAPDFSALDQFDFEGYKEKIDEITAYVSGALLALGAILFFSGANMPLGLALMAAGALGLAAVIKENWNAAEGPVKDAINRTLLILGGALLVLGAILTFSGANIPLGIGLMAAGATALAAAAALNWDSMSEEVKSAITKILLILGVSLLVLGAILALSGANVPLGIGLMVAGATALAAAAMLNWDILSEEVKRVLVQILIVVGSFLLVIGIILALSGANVKLGLGLMAAGAVALASAAVLDWEYVYNNLDTIITGIFILLGTFLLVVGAVLAFSGANIKLGIGLMIAGVGSLAAAAVLNWGFLTEEVKKTLVDIFIAAGQFLLALGLILALSGAGLKLGLGLMAVGAASLAAAAVLDWEYVSSNIKDIISQVHGWVSVALLVLGAIFTFSGVNLPLGIKLMLLGAASLATYAYLNWDSIVTAIQGPIGKIAAAASAALLVLGIILCCTGVGIPLGVALIAAGAVGLVTVTALNWDAILEKLKGVWESIKQWWNTSVSKYFTFKYWEDLGKDMIDGILSGLKNIFSGISKWASDVWGSITDAFSSKNAKASVNNSASSRSGYTRSASIPDISSFSIPRLATGTVIPPNREFMAVLGDNKKEAEIVSPLSTMKQAMLEALQETTGSETITVVVNLDGREVARNTVRHVNNMTRAAGKPVLLI